MRYQMHWFTLQRVLLLYNIFEAWAFVRYNQRKNFHRKPMTTDTLSNEFSRRVLALEARAKAAGTSMSRICNTTGIVARATYERWRVCVPQNIRALDELEAEVQRLEKEAAAAAAQPAAEPAPASN